MPEHPPEPTTSLAQPGAPAETRRGRPPKQGGATPRAEVQRAYRARLAAAGKVVRIVDAGAVGEHETIADMRQRLSRALSELEVCREDLARLEKRNAQLDAELRLQGQHLTVALKDNVVLKQRAK